jgi:hypothetical protein
MKKNNQILYYLFFLFFVIATVIHFNHYLLFILYGITAILLHPAIFSYLVHYFKIKHQKTVYVLTGIGLFLLSLPLISSYSQYDERILKYKQTEEKRLEQSNIQQHEDSVRIQKQNDQVSLKSVDQLMKIKKFKAALVLLDSLIETSPASADFVYIRGICFQKTGSMQKAVADLKSAKEMGNEKAESLYEKLNPIKKYIIGYMTRCCDGTSSSARGRGACSHHGGVCNWNEPIYEERRKFE